MSDKFFETNVNSIFSDFAPDEHLKQCIIPVLYSAGYITPDKKETYSNLQFSEYIFLLSYTDVLYIEFENEKIALKANEGIFINARVNFSVYSPERTKINMAVLFFHPSAIFDHGLNKLAIFYNNPIMANSENFKYLLFDTTEPLGAGFLAHINSIAELLSKREFAFELTIKSELCQLWKELISTQQDNLSKTLTQRYVNDETRITQAMLYIDIHYQDTITLDNLAKHLNISKSECCRCFNRMLQMSPMEYIVQYRITTAARMLNDISVSTSISDIAIQVGFNNISYFNKAFKATIGCTPTEYRRHHLQASKE